MSKRPIDWDERNGRPRLTADTPPDAGLSVLLGEFYCVGKSVKPEYKSLTSQVAVYSVTGCKCKIETIDSL